MRSLKIDRKRKSGRPKSGRKAVRASRERAAPKRSGRRKESDDGFIARLQDRITALFSFSRPVLLLTASLLLLVVMGALFAGGYVGRSVKAVNEATDTVMAEAGFGIAAVHIGGNLRTPPETILAALGFAPGQSIFDADLQGARARLMGLDWVKDADVVRRYPDTINVRLIEKVPFALWQSGDQVLVVKREGGKITGQDINAYVHLPFLMGAGAPGTGLSDRRCRGRPRALSAV